VRAALMGYADEQLVHVLERMLEPDPDVRAQRILPLLSIKVPASSSIVERPSQRRPVPQELRPLRQAGPVPVAAPPAPERIKQGRSASSTGSSAGDPPQVAAVYRSPYPPAVWPRNWVHVRPRESRSPRLVVLQGPDIGRQIELGDETVQIGRGEDATVRVESDLISRKHACIQRLGNAYMIQDQGSTNGTFVNGQKVGTRRLSEGDLIKLDKVVLRYTESDAEDEQIREQAIVDALTGAYNKRYFDENYGRLVAQCTESGRAFSLIVFDIDHFKKINDTYGHLAGDGVLSGIGDAVRAELLDGEILCRVGGEEFAIIASGRPLTEMRKLAEQVRAAVERAVFSAEGDRIPVTISLGVSALEQAPGEAQALYRLADERLYQAKRGGRNRVCR
jgi:two-component system, cell cycle response regulator